MHNKKIINLIVSSSSVPFNLTILTCNGLFISKKTIASKTTKLCLCTKTCCLKLVANYQNQTLVKRVNLFNVRCQNIVAHFNFFTLAPTPPPQPQKQNFVLLDKNYNLPISNAVLSFTAQ